MSITSKEDGERVLESTLTVTSPFLDGIGNYTCMAENVVDTANSTAEVMIFCESLLDTIALYVYETDLYTVLSTLLYTIHPTCSCSLSCTANSFCVTTA